MGMKGFNADDLPPGSRISKSVAESLLGRNLRNPPEGDPFQEALRAIEESEVLANPPVQRRKFRNTPTEYKGERYDSKGEAALSQRLDYLIETHLIQVKLRQVSICLGVPEFRVRPDFFLVLPIVGGSTSRNFCFVDYKGKATQAFQKTIPLWLQHGPCPLILVRPRSMKVPNEVLLPPDWRTWRHPLLSRLEVTELIRA